MTQPTPGRKSSRQRFEDYQDKLATRLKQGTAEEDQKSGSKIRSRRVRSAWTLVKEFWRLLGDQRGTVLFALGTLTFATLLALIPPAASKFVIDYVLGDKPIPSDIPGAQYLPESKLHLLYWVAGGILVFSLLKTGLHIWGRWKATSASKRMQMSVRKTVFEHAVRLPLHRVQELRSGGVSSILREDAGSVGPLIFGMLYNPWRAVIQLFGSLIILAWVDWRMLMAALLLIPVVFLSHRLWINRLRPRFRDIRASRETIDAQSAEAFAGMRVVRGFSRQRRETSRFMENNHYMARQELNTWWWTRYIELLWDFIIPFTSTAVLLYCGMQVLEGQMSVGDVMMFVVYLIMLLEPLAVLAESATEFQNSLSALDRVLDLLSEEREMQNSAGILKIEKATSPGLIRFADVTFRYPGTETAALHHATLEARPGQVIALVGPSGAGKTTLCNLVARFYDPTEGTVSVDGRDLRTIDVESYRQLMGVVEQDIFLFDGTVEENIAYAFPEATREEVLHAAHVANAHEFIVELAEGYDTVIGERGVKLSGGQRQRLAIARAILADPRILILDEATSNLDTHSERLIQQSLRELMRNRTCFVIAHRLSTITHADEILVLIDGEISERGTHEELLARDGRYAEMVRLQIEKPEAAVRE